MLSTVSATLPTAVSATLSCHGVTVPAAGLQLRDGGAGGETGPKHPGASVSDHKREQREDVVHLAPSETEKLLQAVAGMVARDRLARGVRLNYPECVALLSTWVIERARDGSSVAELMTSGREVLGRNEVMDGVPEMLSEVQVEATFPDGRKLVTIHHPIGS